MKRKDGPLRRSDGPGAAKPSRTASGSRRVLVVDRDNETLVLCRAALAIEDFLVEMHDNAVGAITAARRDPPDLVLISLQLGDASALEVVEWLRSTPELRDSEVIALTAMEDDYTRLAANGVTVILRKPLTVAAIRRAVRGAFPRAR